MKITSSNFEDGAWNPRPRSKDDDFAIHFALGYPF